MCFQFLIFFILVTILFIDITLQNMEKNDRKLAISPYRDPIMGQNRVVKSCESHKSKFYGLKYVKLKPLVHIEWIKHISSP